MVKMSVAASAALILVSVAVQGAKAADAIPYSPNGYNATSYSFVATGGDITAYFASASAGNDNTVGAMIGGAAPTVFGLDDHSATVGQSLLLGSATAGETVVFVLDSNGAFIYSDPAMNTGFDAGPATGSTDGHNHIYSTAYTATAPVFGNTPTGTFVAFEDLSFPNSDYDYNDEAFVVTGISAAPEPETWAMMLVGFAGLGAAMRSTRRKPAAAATA